MHGDGCSVSCIVMASLILVEVLIIGLVQSIRL